MTSITYKNLDTRLANFEETLNTLGYIPIVSTASGSVRIVYGSLETVAGNVSCVYKGCQYFITGNREHRNQAAAHYLYAVHGALNVQRGIVEFVPIIGNTVVFLYDKAARLRANYTYEQISPKTLPIFDPSKSETLYGRTLIS